MYSHQLTTITAAALTVFALLVFTVPASAEPPDSFRTEPYVQTQDLRTPDTRDAAAPRGESAVVQPKQELRSPDTRDAALISQGLLEVPETSTITVDRVDGPVAAQTSPSGFDWLDAAIGAAGALGLALIATGTALAIRRRTHDRPAVA